MSKTIKDRENANGLSEDVFVEFKEIRNELVELLKLVQGLDQRLTTIEKDNPLINEEIKKIKEVLKL